MAKGDICKVSSCNNIISKGRKGLVCGTHQNRMRKFGSYDLPNHIGEPSYLKKEKLPENIIKICSIHGNLTINDAYPMLYKGKINSYNCKKCSRERYIKKKYGNSGKDYDSMLKSQNGLCAICKKPETMKANNKHSIKKMSLDHCHSSGKVRELLCNFCNSGIGYFKDSIEILQSAINYLNKHKELSNDAASHTKDVPQASQNPLEQYDARTESTIE